MTTPKPSDRFEDRFEDLAAIAYRVTYRILGSRPDAEDLTQEALTRAYQRWRKVRGHAEPWVARVATNLALDAIRRGKRRPTVSDADADERQAPAGASVVDRLELVRVLQDLPKRQREAVALRYLADLSEADVARELGISVGSVKQHASRGLAALRISAGLNEPGPPEGHRGNAEAGTPVPADRPHQAGGTDAAGRTDETDPTTTTTTTPPPVASDHESHGDA